MSQTLAGPPAPEDRGFTAGQIAFAAAESAIAEEARTGTLELMLTRPVREVELVIGKFLGAFVLLLFMLAVTLVFPFIMLQFGNPDRGPIVSGYVGVILQGAAFLAIGLMIFAMDWLLQLILVRGLPVLFGR